MVRKVRGRAATGRTKRWCACCGPSRTVLLAVAAAAASFVGGSVEVADAQPVSCFGEAATIVVGGGEVTWGTPGPDVIVGTSGPDEIHGRGGADLICGLGGNDRIWGNGGRDRINAGGGADRVWGGKSADHILGSTGDDRLYGNTGADTIVGGKGDDWLSGGKGNDVVRGRSGDDVLKGKSGDDRLRAGRGRDRCEPGSGRGSFRGCEMIEATAAQLLAELGTAVEDRAGYDRGLFSHWSDLDGGGCDTRQEVLTAESTVRVGTSDGCRVTSGSWLSRFDHVTVSEPSGLDIDHLVPLAEAWDSGANSWDAQTRERFANDLGDGRSLIAVTASTNRSKGDRDPAGWLPPAASYRCRYVADWVAVKTRWVLSIDQAELSVLADWVAGCPARRSLVTVATIGPAEDSDDGPGGVPPNPGDTKNCGGFATYADAKAWFDFYFPFYGDIARLDANNDGIPCQSLPGAP